MTKILTPVAAYGSNPTYPEDGIDPETAAGLEVSIQTAINRAELAKTRLDAGIQKIRSVATVAALKAVTGQATGDHIVVVDTGLFQFDGASLATSDDVTVVTPTAGGGRWLGVGRSARVANGYAPLDATAKVPVANLRGQLLASSSNATVGTTTGNLTTQTQAILAGQLPVTLAVGDLLISQIVGTFTISTGSNSVVMGMTITQPDTTNVNVAYASTGQDSLDKFFGLHGIFRATQAGTHSLRLITVYSVIPSSVAFTLQIGCTFSHHRFAAP